VFDHLPTGQFRWRVVLTNRVRAGQIAGHNNGAGYRLIMIGGVRYVAARLAWLYMLGRWPDHEAKHADGDPANDAWENLREGANRL
jgi:HNH endonuclease